MYRFLSSIGTKNYRYDDFNDRVLSCSNGLEVRVDTFTNSPDSNPLDRQENLYVSIGFLDRNIDRAFECLTEIIATPNFDEPSNISDLVKMEAISKANTIGQKGLDYAKSYGQSGLKAYARSFEDLRGDVFFCQYAAEILKTSNPLNILKDAIEHMSEIASYVFREENMEFSIHGSKKKFAMIQMKLEMMLNTIKNENSRFLQKHSNLDIIPSEFEKAVYYKNFFKTPLTVNNCTESMIGPTYANYEDYAVFQVLANLMTFTYLLPSIREKGGAYGAGVSANENGLVTFYSFRDPKVEETYDNFEKGLDSLLDANFSEKDMTEAKLLTFQKLDRIQEPSLKGMLAFSRGYTDEHRMKLRLRALEVSKQDITRVAEKYMVKAIEEGKTSRVVFGSQHANLEDLQTKKGWTVHNPIDFLSYSYFDQWNKQDNNAPK